MIFMLTKKINRLNTWFFKIEGFSEANEDIDYPFGFFVNCLISTKVNLNTAKKTVISDLELDSYKIANIEYSGKFQDFSWDEKDIQIELDKLAKETEENPEIVHYSNFHIWER